MFTSSTSFTGSPNLKGRNAMPLHRLRRILFARCLCNAAARNGQRENNPISLPWARTRDLQVSRNESRSSNQLSQRASRQKYMHMIKIRHLFQIIYLFFLHIRHCHVTFFFFLFAVLQKSFYGLFIL